MKKTITAAALAAIMAVPVQAQNTDNVVIKGSLIDWYYYGKDIHSSQEGWYQQPVGGGAWIEWLDDGTSVAHPTGASNYGLMSLTLVPGTPRPILPEFLIRNHVLYSNCGGLYMGGEEYYSFYGRETGWEDGMEGEYGSEGYEIVIRKWTWAGTNPDGSYHDVKYEEVGKMYNQPTDLTYDPFNDIVYGVFNVGGGYKLGTLDMTTFEIKWISREIMPLTGELRTLAINSKGELYGTDKGGNVYEVSTEDGKLTYIGNMGFQSQEKMMSATFDMRTDKLYWVGFMNNGKASGDTSGTNTTMSVADGGRDTGVYEINTQTGEATLIGKTDITDVIPQYDENGQLVGAVVNKYGKMQLTGIYVEGSFVKPNYDLKVEIKEYPLQMTAGRHTLSKVVATVKNAGMKSIRGTKYSVNFFADGQQMAYIDYLGEDVYTHDLDPGQSYDYTFYYPAPETPGEKTIRVVVSCDTDENQANNQAEANVNVLSKEVFLPVTIEGTGEGNKVTLTWKYPRGKYVEGAEDYIPFSYNDLGPWLMYDGDKGLTQKANSWNMAIEYPNWNTPKAYIVMDPVKAGFDLTVGGEKFYPHSGNNYFASWWTIMPDNSEAGGHQVPNDDWLISPKLDGMPQTISFWAKGYKGTETPGYQTDMNHPELMRVMTTYTEYVPETDFVREHWMAIKDTFQVSNTEWTQYTAEVPQGAMHFALQCCSKEGFVLMLDDIAFDVPYKKVTGYKVYRNGQMAAIIGEKGSSYTDDAAVKGNVYTVAVIYADGESAQSNKFIYGLDKEHGDVNGDGVVDVADIANIIYVMSKGMYIQVADANQDGAVDVADIVYVINLMSAL